MIAITEIQPIHQDAVFQILSEVSVELWGISLDELRLIDTLHDLDDPPGYFKRQDGIFKVILNEGTVVGMGGILKFEGWTCELKRIFIRKEFRGKGLGKLIITDLLDFGVSQGYRKAVLEVATPGVQAAAIRLYEHLGFVEIPRYRPGPCAYAMQKSLTRDAQK